MIFFQRNLGCIINIFSVLQKKCHFLPLVGAPTMGNVQSDKNLGLCAHFKTNWVSIQALDGKKVAGATFFSSGLNLPPNTSNVYMHKAK